MQEKKIVTRDVLKAFALGGIVVASLAMPNLPIALGILHKAIKQSKSKELGRIINRLEKQEMVTIRENGENISIEITEKGRKRLLTYDFEQMHLTAKKRDGKWRLVIFDIPEDKRTARDMFRRKLIHLGLVRLQDSVFVSAFPCKKEIDFLCHYLEISDYVTVTSLYKIERGEYILFKNYRNWDNESL